MGCSAKSLTYYYTLTLSSLIWSGLLLSLFSPFIKPINTTLFSYFGLFYLPLLLIGIFWIFYLYTFKRKSRHLTITILLVAVSLIHSPNYFQWSKINIRKIIEEPNLTVASFNASKYLNIADAVKEVKTEYALHLAHFANDHKIDVLLIQEHTRRNTETDAILRNTPLKYLCNIQESSLAIFSKFPLRNCSLDKYENSVNGALSAILVSPHNCYLVLNLHLPSNNIKVTKNVNGVFKQNNTPTIFDIFLNFGAASEKRSHKIESLLHKIKSTTFQTKKRVIIAGDLNDTPSSNIYHVLNSEFNDSFTKAGYGWGGTFTKYLLSLRLDYIFTSKKIAVTRYNSHNLKFSDHKILITGILDN